MPHKIVIICNIMHYIVVCKYLLNKNRKKLIIYYFFNYLFFTEILCAKQSSIGKKLATTHWHTVGHKLIFNWRFISIRLAGWSGELEWISNATLSNKQACSTMSRCLVAQHKPGTRGATGVLVSMVITLTWFIGPCRKTSEIWIID